MGIWLSVIGLAFNFNLAHAEAVQLDLPVSSAAAQLRFRAVIDDAQDELLFSEDGGAHWRSAFVGHMRQLQLPVTRREAPLGWIYLHKLALLRRNLALTYAEEELDPHHWFLTLQTQTGLAVITPRRTFLLPDVREVRRARLLDEGATWQILAVQGTENRGTFLFVDGQATLRLSDQFIDGPIDAVITDNEFIPTDAARAERYHLARIRLDTEGRAKWELGIRRWRAVDELIGSVNHAEHELIEATYIDLLDARISRKLFIGRDQSVINEVLLDHAKNILRAKMFERQPRLPAYARADETSASFNLLLTDLAIAWISGQAQLEPLLRMIDLRLSGRRYTLPVCKPDLEGATSAQLVTLELIGTALDHISRDLRGPR